MKIKQVVEKEFVHVEELIEASGEGLWKMYPDGEVVFYNKEFYKKIDIDPQKAMIDDWIRLIHPEDTKQFSENLTEHISGELSRFTSQYRIKSKMGDYIWIEAKAAARYDEKGQFLYMVGSHMNITKRKEYEKMVHDLAYKDQLTGLYNRQKLSEMMKSENSSYRILYMNLSKFRMINDTYGYEAANRVLKLFAEALLAVFDSPEHVFRVDADEFAIVLVGSYSDENIKRLIKHFTLGFKELIYAFINGLDINLYMGLSLPSEGKDENLLEQAKWAGLYAKRKELDYCVIYNAEIKEETERGLFMELGIRKGLKTNEFFMVF